MKRWLILMLTLALCLIPVQGGFAAALAEQDGLSEPVEAQAELAQSTGADGLVIEGLEAEAAPEAAGETNPETASEAAAEAGDQVNPDIVPEASSEAASETAPEASPEAASETVPEASSEAASETAPEASSETVSQTASEADPETTYSETVPESAPEAVFEPAPEPAPEAAVEAPAEAPVPEYVDPAMAEPAPVDAQVMAAPGEPADMALNYTELVLGVKESFAMAATLLPEGSSSAVTWRTSAPKIVKVNAETGMIMGAKKGTAIIYATTANGIEKSCQVTVMKAPKKVSLNAAKLILSGGGQTYQLSVTLPKKTGCFLYFESSDPNVVAVNAGGLLTTVNPGTATVTVKTFNGKSASCAVRVLDPSIPTPNVVQLAAGSVTIGVKQSYALSPAFLAADGTPIPDVEYEVTSSNKKKLAVSQDGVITGVKAGSYTVTVTAYNGASATCAVKVEKAPSKVTVAPAKATLGLGQTRQLSVAFPKGGIATYGFSSSNPDVVAVDANGYVTGLQLGSAVITVRTSNGKTAKSTVTVSRGPDYMALNADYELQFDPLANSYSTVYVKTMNPGETFQLTTENEYLTYGDIAAFESSDGSIAVVSADGVITAVAPGTATIVVRSTSGAEAYCRVTVAGSLPASIAFTAQDAVVRAGQSASVPKLKGSNIDAGTLAAASYASSDEGVFTIAWSDTDAEWKLNGINPGSASLIATAAGATASLPVTVAPASASAELRFDSGLVYMSVGDVWKPGVRDEYGVSIDAALTSDNPAVVSVDEAGNLIGVAEGSATVTAAWNDLTASMSVNVRTGAAALTLSAGEMHLGSGQRATLTAQVNGDGSSANLSFASSDGSVASVNQSGTVVARSAGTAVITVTAYGGASASCTVTVSPAPTHISLQPASVTGRLDEVGAQLSWAFGAPDELGSVSFASNNPQVATVSDSGYVSFVAAGRAVVTATTNNGLTASIDVTVLPAKTVSSTPTYRLFAAYSYANSEYKGYLPFPQNNGKSVASVFGQSSISGLGYSTKVMGNPSKTQLLSGISGFFASSADVDVSIVYLCSHGHMTNGYGGYRLSLPGYDDNTGNANYYITAQEIMNCLTRINGNVVLILDSCYSGAFLQDMQGQLDAQGGRIAVLTAASDTRATYYKVKKESKSVDFFTFFLLKGLGYNHRDGWWNSNAKGSKGAYPGYLAADAAGNGDGIVTLGEFFNYASNSIAANIPSYMKKSWYWGDPTRVQTPRYYAGSLNDLVIYQPR